MREVKAEKPVRTHWDMLLERRSEKELEDILKERLELLRGGEIGPAHLHRANAKKKRQGAPERSSPTGHRAGGSSSTTSPRTTPWSRGGCWVRGRRCVARRRADRGRPSATRWSGPGQQPPGHRPGERQDQQDPEDVGDEARR